MKSEAKRVLREAKAGLNDKGDLVVHLKPAGDQSGVQLDIESKGMSLFGEQIRASVLETIESYTFLLQLKSNFKSFAVITVCIH
jgi:citrate lyase gamma subunit